MIAGNEKDLDLVDNARVTVHEVSIGVGGVDATPVGNLAWLLGPRGVEAEAAAPGRTPGLSVIAAPLMLDAESFEEDFRSPERIWAFGGDVRRIEKRDGDLRTTLRGASGRVGRRVDWEVSADATLAVELACEGLTAVRLLLVPADGIEPLEIDCRLGADPSAYAFTELAVPPGRYRGLLFELDGTRDGGQLSLHAWHLAANPTSD